MATEKISTPLAPAAIGPYSQAVKANGFIFVSGALPVDMKTGAMSEGDIGEKTRCCLNNLNEILKAAGSDLSKAVKTTVYLKDLGNFAAMNAAYAEFFTGVAPARACVQVAALPKDADIEIEVTAVE